MWAVLISLTYIFSQSSAQPFYWSSSGPVANKVCVQIIETSDIAGTWTDNYLCSDTDFGMKWSSAGAISGMTCTQIIETAEPDATTWDDNFLCVPPDSPLHFSWSSAGAISGKPCIQIIEAADLHTWNDNYLCWEACDFLSCDNGELCDGVETCANGGCVAGTPAIDIDGYLECSASFAALEGQVETAFLEIQRLRRKLGFNAQTGPSNFLDGSFGGETGANALNGKDIFIIALLLLNLLVMSWLYCCKGVAKKYRKVRVFSDSEAQQLRS